MNIEVIRSRRKSLCIEVGRGCRVLVRAPVRLPQREIDEFVAKKRAWIEKALHEQQEKAERMRRLSDEEIEQLRLRAKRVLGEKLGRYAKIMGVVPQGMRITSAKTRFGSCSGKNSICFSWRLMLYPDAAIDYVVVHELAHILHKNHSADFHACVARVLPDHKARRALLRKHPEVDEK